MANQINNEKSSWPQLKDFKNTIRLEFSLYISGIILVLMLITGYVITNQYVETVSSNVIEKHLVQARSYSSSSGKLILSTNGPDALLLNNICKKLSNEDNDIFWCGIVDSTNSFIAHTDIKKVIANTQAQDFITGGFDGLLYLSEKVKVLPDSILIEVPIVENNINLGNLIMVSSTKEITSAKMKSIQTVALTTLFMFLLGVPLTTFMLHKKLKPIKTITNCLQKMDFEKFDLNIPITNKNELGYLSESLKVMGIKLHQAQKEHLERDRISREFEIASEIQSKILPRTYPKSGRFEFAGAYKSAKEIGGDYYDFIELDNEHLGVLIADVSGKSLPGMLIMLLTRDIVRNLSRHIKDPAEILSLTNEQLLPNIKKGMFVTMFYGVLNTTNGTFEFASAGHNPLLHIDNNTGRHELIKTKGYPLGLMTPEIFNKRIEKGTLHLDSEHVLIQFTDGINEAKNSDGNEYEMERFIQSIESIKNMNPQKLVDQTLKSLDSFVGNCEQFDDITLLILKWKENKNIYSKINEKEGANVC